MQLATLVIASLSLATSLATLGLMVAGAKRVEAKVEEARTKSNEGLNRLRTALAEVEL